MELYERAKTAADFIRDWIDDVPDTAIVLGSGLGAFVRSVKLEIEIPYSEIPGFVCPSVKGHEGSLFVGIASGKRIFVLQGRIHAYEGHSMEDVTFYVRVLALLGVRTLVLTNAAGGINMNFCPGDLMLITDHMSFCCPSPLWGPNDERFGPRFPAMNEAYSKRLRTLAMNAAATARLPVRSGVYFYAKGPMYETPAEICTMRLFGADAVGMSTVAETIVAVHCGMEVLGISCITNMAAGITGKQLSHQEVIDNSRYAENDFVALLLGFFGQLASN